MLTDKEKYEIVSLLGWTPKVLIVGSTDYSKILSDRLSNLPQGVEELIREKLHRLRMVDDKREAALCRASTKSVGDIVLNTDELYILDKERRRLLMELSDLTDVPMTGKSTGGANVSVCS
jgi:hypothetical protein